jgi:hypothetical protein
VRLPRTSVIGYATRQETPPHGAGLQSARLRTNMPAGQRIRPAYAGRPRPNWRWRRAAAWRAWRSCRSRPTGRSCRRSARQPPAARRHLLLRPAKCGATRCADKPVMCVAQGGSCAAGSLSRLESGRDPRLIDVGAQGGQLSIASLGDPPQRRGTERQPARLSVPGYCRAWKWAVTVAGGRAEL